MRGWISSNWLCLHGNSCCERCILASLILLLTIFICEISSLCEGKSLKATNCRAAYAVMSSKEDYKSDQQTCISFLPSRLQSLFILCHNTTPNDWSTGVQHSGSLCVEEEPNDAQNAPYYVTANRFWSAQPEWTKTAGNQVLVPIISEQRARLCWTEWVRSDRGGGLVVELGVLTNPIYRIHSSHCRAASQSSNKTNAATDACPMPKTISLTHTHNFSLYYRCTPARVNRVRRGSVRMDYRTCSRTDSGLPQSKSSSHRHLSGMPTGVRWFLDKVSPVHPKKTQQDSEYLPYLRCCQRNGFSGGLLAFGVCRSSDCWSLNMGHLSATD